PPIVVTGVVVVPGMVVVGVGAAAARFAPLAFVGLRAMISSLSRVVIPDGRIGILAAKASKICTECWGRRIAREWAIPSPLQPRAGARIWLKEDRTWPARQFGFTAESRSWA